MSPPLSRRRCRAGSPTRRRGSETGFTLLEAVVSLAILALALTLGLAFLSRLPGFFDRLEAQRQAGRQAEAVLEGLRGGIVPIAAGEIAPPLPLDGAGQRAVRIGLVLRGSDTPYVTDVVVQVRSRVRQQVVERSFETKIWQP